LLAVIKLLDVSGSCIYRRENALYMERKILFVNRDHSTLFSFALCNVTIDTLLLLYTRYTYQIVGSPSRA